MLLKRFDELLNSGHYDLKESSDLQDCYLVQPSLKDELVEWSIVEKGRVSRKLLHYNDAADSSNKLNGSCQKFYASEAAFGKGTIYNGSSIFFQNGLPCFGGVAKAAIYMRYSKGLLNWLSSFDSAASGKIMAEVSGFEAMMVDKKTKKLPAVWHKFKAEREKWALPVICRLTGGKYLIFGLSRVENGNYEDLEDMDVDVSRSLELMDFLTTPAVAAKEVIADLFQTGSGVGRNAFGKTFDLDEIKNSEFLRLMGINPENSRDALLKIWSNHLEYKVKVAPCPDTSTMIFLPEKDLKYSSLKQFIDNENTRRNLYFAALAEKKNKKTKGNEDAEALKVSRPNVIPPVGSATVFLANIEGSQKKKLILQQVFYGVSLPYLQMLNHELLISNLQYAVVGYMKTVLTGQDSDTPSVYRYWTTVFTSGLQMQFISAWEVFHSFQRFAKAHSGEKLTEGGASRLYFQVIGKLLRLQNLIDTARNHPDRLATKEFEVNQEKIEKFEIINTIGVFGTMRKDLPPTEDFVGEIYGALATWQQEKIDRFARMAYSGVPDADFGLFMRGALTGMLLNELTWILQTEERHFTATQGRHPSRLRGVELQQVFNKGFSLLENLEKISRFNCGIIPFIKSFEQDSLRDSFNSGLIMGLGFFNNKKKDDSEKSEK